MKEQYYGETFARAIIFTDNIEKIINKFEEVIKKIDINMAELLVVISDTILSYAEGGFVNNKAKGNIYFFLHTVSQMNIDKKAIQVYNSYHKEILDMLNGDAKDNCLNEFYRLELCIRRNQEDYLRTMKVSNDKIKDKSIDVNRSILFDVNVLLGHLDANDADFAKRLIHYAVSPYYVESSRYLIYKYPTLLNEGHFKERICATLEQRSSLNKKYRKNILRCFSLDKKKRYLGSISYGKDTKKLYKQLIGD